MNKKTKYPVPMVYITAIESYSNGSIEGASQWRAGETRFLPFSVVNYLEQDLPGNWMVIWPKDEGEGE